MTHRPLLSTDGQTTEPRLRRRGFLLGGGAAGAVGVATALSGTAGLSQAPGTGTAKAQAEEPKGYRLSEHVRQYYRSTLV